MNNLETRGQRDESGEKALIACLYHKIQKSSLRLQGQRLLVLIVKENYRVTRTIAVTGTIELPWTIGHMSPPLNSDTREGSKP